VTPAPSSGGLKAEEIPRLHRNGALPAQVQNSPILLHLLVNKVIINKNSNANFFEPVSIKLNESLIPYTLDETSETEIYIHIGKRRS
jgi:hypothetical protein